MNGRVRQYETFDPPTRLFFMDARRTGVPVDVFHRYSGSAASMRGRVLGLLTVLDADGPEMTRSETVTVLNDMVFMAPGALVDAPIEWEPLDSRRVRATFSNAGWTVSGVLHFDDAGDLVDFHSDDRFQSLDGTTYRRFRWSTPLSDHRDFDGLRLPAHGEARWTEPRGEWAYVELWLERVVVNPRVYR